MTQNAVTTKSPEQTINEWFQSSQKALSKGLPANTVSLDRFYQVFMTAYKNGSNALKLSTLSSLSFAIKSAANLGFEIGGALGQSYLVPFKNNKLNRYEVQLIIGYQGWMDLVYRSGLVSDIDATCVFEGDEFEYEKGLSPTLRHIEKSPTNQRNKDHLTHVYAIVRYMDISIQPKFEVLTKSDVERFRNLSKAKTGDAWSKFYLEMAKKTAIARVLKYVRKSPELALGMAVEEQQYGGEAPVIDIDVDIIDDDQPKIEEQPKADEMADKIKADREAKKKEVENEVVDETTGEIQEEKTPVPNGAISEPKSDSNVEPEPSDDPVPNSDEISEVVGTPEPELALTPPTDDVPPPMSREDKWEHIKQLLADKEPKTKVGKDDYEQIETMFLNLELGDVPDNRLDEMIDVLEAMPAKGKNKSPGKRVAKGE